MQIGNRDDAEVDEQRLQQIFARDEWIGDEGRECASVEVLQDRSTERGLAGADLAGEDNETFPALDPGQQLVERRSVCRAPEQEPRVGRQAERLFVQPVERFVHERCRDARPRPRRVEEGPRSCVVDGKHRTSLWVKAGSPPVCERRQQHPVRVIKGPKRAPF